MPSRLRTCARARGQAPRRCLARAAPLDAARDLPEHVAVRGVTGGGGSRWDATSSAWSSPARTGAGYRDKVRQLPRRVRADAARVAVRLRAADDRPGDRAQPRRRAGRARDAQRRGARRDRRPGLPDRAGPVQPRDQRRRRGARRATALAELEEEVRASLNGADERARTARRAPGHDRHPADAAAAARARSTRCPPTRATRCSTSRSSRPAARTCSSRSTAPERLRTYADSITPEAACTSVQLHLQVSPDAFAPYWNAAQAIAGVQVAVAANSPFLFGKELWHETRIPLFEQATDTRPEELKEQGVRPRVWFGERWITSVFDLFEENVRYFPALLPICDDEDPSAELDRGEVPALAELTLHNGTVYRWNRPVYAVVDGQPAPAGGEPGAARRPDGRRRRGQRGVLLRAGARASPRRSGRSGRRCRSSAAEENLHAGARHGLDARLYWPGAGRGARASELVLRRLLPLAHEGLDTLGRRPGRARPAARHHRAALPDRPNGRGWQIDDRARDRSRSGADRGRRAARDDPALHRAHAHQRARAHLGSAETAPRLGGRS